MMLSRRMFAAAILAGLSSTGLATAAVVTQTVAVYGQAVPGTPAYAGEIFQPTAGASPSAAFGTPSINSAGNVAFWAVTNGSGAVTTTTTNTSLENNAGIYTGNGSSLSLVAHDGTYAPTYAPTAGASVTANSGSFSNFSTGSAIPVIDNNGNFFIYATLASVAVTSEANIGNAITDSNGITIGSFSIPGQTTPGNSNHSANTFAIYSSAFNSGTLALAARNDDAAATGGTGYYKALNAGSTFTAVVSQKNGAFAEIVNLGSGYTSNLGSNANTSGILEANYSTGALQIIGFDGTVAPGTNGQYFYSYSNSSGGTIISKPEINSSGQVAFIDDTASVTNASMQASPTISGAGIFSQGGGTLHAVAYTGNAAPSLINDVYGSSTAAPGSPDINNAGQVAFTSGLANASSGVGDVVTGSSGNNYALYVETPSTAIGGGTSSYNLILRKGAPAPGFSSGLVEATNNPFGAPAINDSGQVAFSTSITGGPTVNGVAVTGALYLYSPSGITQLLAYTGESIPNTIDLLGGISSYYLNDNGAAIFSTTPTGSDVNSTNNSGIWAVDAQGNLYQVIRKGETGAQFGLPPSSPYYNDYVYSWFAGFLSAANSGGEDGRNPGWNDSGTVPLEVNFDAAPGSTTIVGSGEFTVTVPEPSSASLLLVAAIGLLGRRNRKASPAG